MREAAKVIALIAGFGLLTVSLAAWSLPLAGAVAGMLLMAGALFVD